MAEGTETPTAAGAASSSSNGSGADLPPAMKIDVTEIATPFREEVRRAIQERYGGVGPKLVAFLANTVRLRAVDGRGGRGVMVGFFGRWDVDGVGWGGLSPQRETYGG